MQRDSALQNIGRFLHHYKRTSQVTVHLQHSLNGPLTTYTLEKGDRTLFDDDRGVFFLESTFFD